MHWAYRAGNLPLGAARIDACLDIKGVSLGRVGVTSAVLGWRRVGGGPGWLRGRAGLLAPAQSEGDRLDPAVDLELVEDILDVVANGRRRQEQLVGDGGPVEALGEEV